jgi:hypothetical protein
VFRRKVLRTTPTTAPGSALLLSHTTIITKNAPSTNAAPAFAVRPTSFALLRFTAIANAIISTATNQRISATVPGCAPSADVPRLGKKNDK